MLRVYFAGMSRARMLHAPFSITPLVSLLLSSPPPSPRLLHLLPSPTPSLPPPPSTPSSYERRPSLRATHRETYMEKKGQKKRGAHSRSRSRGARRRTMTAGGGRLYTRGHTRRVRGEGGWTREEGRKGDARRMRDGSKSVVVRNARKREKRKREEVREEDGGRADGVSRHSREKTEQSRQGDKAERQRQKTVTVRY